MISPISRRILKHKYCKIWNIMNRTISTNKTDYFGDYLKNVLLDTKKNSKKYENVTINLLNKWNELTENINSLRELKTNEKDVDLDKTIMQEENVYAEQLNEIENELTIKLAEIVSNNISGDEVIIEISPGVGGQEAMLFAKSLYNMYNRFITFKNWEIIHRDLDESELGGVRHATILVSGKNIFNNLQFETGVHKVIRVPSTEKGGRLHTSTVSVAILPQPQDIHLNIDDKDLLIETKRATGAGGQHVNKTDSAVRIVHLPTGISVESQADRSQIKNKKTAIKRLRAKLYEIELEKQQKEFRNLKKMQIGTKARSERVRIYHFMQDQINDSRLSKNLQNVDKFLNEPACLDNLIKQLAEINHREQIDLFLENIKMSKGQII